MGLLAYSHPTVEAKVRIEKNEYDGNTIQNETIIKPNLPTSDEEIEVVRKYDEQKKLAIKRSQAKSVGTYQGTHLCSCVLGLNAHFGTNFHTLDGYARSIPTNSTVPAEMGFVITRESWKGHISHYYHLGDVIVIDWETNYVSCQMTSGRVIPVDSGLIKGYIN